MRNANNTRRLLTGEMQSQGCGSLMSKTNSLGNAPHRIVAEDRLFSRCGDNHDIVVRDEVYIQLREDETTLRTVFQTVQTGIVIIDPETHTIVEVNPAAAEIIGESRERIVGAECHRFICPAEKGRCPVTDLHQHVDNSERVLLTADGNERQILKTVVPVMLHGREHLLESFVDITERKLLERRQHLFTEILSILNAPLSMADTINHVLAVIKLETGFDAVGLRLKNGEDFPYYAQEGFSSEFLVLENSLVVRGKKGGVCRDKNGDISLECTCGLVISGKTDPANPLFTPGGSCWVNNSLPLLDLPADQDPRLHPRNRCIHDGFLSVALIPIRANQEIVGLLQLNDRRANSLTLEMVEHFEDICTGIGLALMQRQSQEALKESEERHRSLFESSRDATMTLEPPDWAFTSCNQATVDMFRVKDAQEFTSLRPWEASPEFQSDGRASADKAKEMIETAMREGSCFFEWIHRRIGGEDFPAEVLLSRVEQGGKAFLQAAVHDIAKRKRAEESLRKIAERDRHIAEVLQRTLIPNQMPAQPQGYEIAARYKPALSEAEVCGDFYDILDLGQGKLGIAVGDVAGKGLLAAVRVATVRHSLRSYAFMGGRPSRVMTLLGEVLDRDAETENHTLTAFFATLDISAGELRYTNAGHEPPLLASSDGRTEYLTTGGPMFSGLTRSAYAEATRVLQAGDVLVMVTDGITESRKADHYEQFGPEGIERCLSENVGASAEEIASAILRGASEFAEGILRDDVVVVIIRKL